jgi:hypothetical protein
MNTLLCFQELTNQTIPLVRDFCDNAGLICEFTPAHFVLDKKGGNPTLNYQQIGFVSTYEPHDAEIDHIIEIANNFRIFANVDDLANDQYLAKISAKYPNMQLFELTKEESCKYCYRIEAVIITDKNELKYFYRFIQIFSVNIDDKMVTVIHSHYHYNPTVNHMTIQMMRSLSAHLKEKGKSVIMIGDFNSNPLDRIGNNYTDMLAECDTFYEEINLTKRIDHILIDQSLEIKNFHLKSLQSIREVGNYLGNKKKSKQTNMIGEENKMIIKKFQRELLSDHELYCVKLVMKNSTLLIGTFNLLAPDDRAAFQLNILFKNRVMQIDRVLDVLKEINKTFKDLTGDCD